MEQKVTVLAAAYNGRSYIEQQMDSILAQSRDGILLVVSDDCSTDGTAQRLDAYEKAHGGQVLVLHRKKPSGGASAHFLSLISLMAKLQAESGSPWKETYELTEDKQMRLREAADADYFMLSDQDDVWLPMKTEKLMAKMRALELKEPDGRRGTPLLVHSDLKVVDENLKEIAPSFFRYQKISPDRTALPQLLVQNNVTGGALMMNRAMLSYLICPPSVCLMHDAWLALVAGCFGQTGYVDEPLYLYRQHKANTLGAEKGDSMEGAKARIKDGSQAAENYRRMFGQAESLLELYKDKLTQEQKETLDAFISLPRQTRTGKIKSIWKYGFTKNTWLRTLGQMLFIGD